MPDLKISDMAAAVQVYGLDLLAIVHGLGNYKTTRQTFLTAIAGESIGLIAPTAYVRINANESIDINAANTQRLSLGAGTGGDVVVIAGSNFGLIVNEIQATLQAGSSYIFASDGVGIYGESGPGESFFWGSNDGTGLLYDGAFLLSLTGIAGVSLHIGNDVAYVDFFSGGQIAFTLPAGTPITIPYQTPNAGDWVGSPPGTYEDALNRIASWVATKVGTIP